MIDLSGRHVIIAGGSRGIGAASAKKIARAGGAVTLTYLDSAEAAHGVVAEIQGQGGSAMAVRADVSVEGEMDRTVAAAEERFGRPWGLVVSAGIFEGRRLEEMTAEFWDRTMAINLRGTILSVRAAAPAMKRGGHGGAIVIYASTAGQRGSAVYSAYAASKGAQILFMRSMAQELAPDRIRVNCIAPAWTDTDMAAPSLDALGRAEVARTFPLGRIGTPEDVADATCFLLSDAAGFITGATLTVDGGMDMRG